MKPLKQAFVITVLFLLSPATILHSVPVTVGVTLHGQNTPSWCWAASAQMLIEFHADLVAQCQLVHDVSPWKACCTTSVCNSDALSADAVFEISPYLYTFGTHTGSLDLNATSAGSTEGVVQQIGASQPFVFRWTWGGGHTGTHEMVAYGYELHTSPHGADYVYVHDPLPVASGDSWIHTYPFFRKATSSKVRVNPITHHSRTFWAHENTFSFIDITPP